MNVYLASFSTPNFSKSHAVLDASARRNGIKNIFHYTFDADVKGTPFYEKNRAIFDIPRGVGYWLWKPFLILESLKKMEDGDILVYADSGVEIIKPLTPVLDICEKEQDIVFFEVHGFTIGAATRRDAFVLMEADTPLYHDAAMIQASFIVIKKTKKAVDFAQEWLAYGENIQIIGELPNICGKPDFPNFIGHRHDQSIASILRVKHQVPIYRNPSQLGNVHIADYPNSPYSQLLYHHWGRPDGRFAGIFRRILLKFGLWRL
jgi:hypothetical protein